MKGRARNKRPALCFVMAKITNGFARNKWGCNNISISINITLVLG